MWGNELLKNEEICIYGCGECGIQTYLILKEKGIQIDFFGDLDNNKAGYVIDGLFCRTYDEILRLAKEDILLIVAIAHRKDLCIEFQQLGFKKVVYYANIKRAVHFNAERNNLKLSLMDVDEIVEMKEKIEKYIYQENISIYEKRDIMLSLLEELKWKNQ